MKISEILSPERIDFRTDVASKKRALELLSNKLADDQGNVSSSDIFDSLLARERLSSTALGKGVALPHGRVKDIDQTLCAFLQLREGIDFDANDHQPVDLLCALLVPEHSTNEHLRVLATLAEMFRDKELCEQLRNTSSNDDLYQQLIQWQPSGRSFSERRSL